MSLILAAAEEPSKTAFYVAGGVLAAWAVLVAFVGITQPEFPKNQAGRTGVMAISVLLVVGAMTAAVVTS